jgi:hypothetical protein
MPTQNNDNLRKKPALYDDEEEIGADEVPFSPMSEDENEILGSGVSMRGEEPETEPIPETVEQSQEVAIGEELEEQRQEFLDDALAAEQEAVIAEQQQGALAAQAAATDATKKAAKKYAFRWIIAWVMSGLVALLCNPITVGSITMTVIIAVAVATLKKLGKNVFFFLN